MIVSKYLNYVTSSSFEQIEVFDMPCGRHLLLVFWQQHIRNQNIVNEPRNLQHHLFCENAACSSSDTSSACRPFSLHKGFITSIHTSMAGKCCGRPTTRWAYSIKHDLHSASLNTTNAAQMVFDTPLESFCKWTANARIQARLFLTLEVK